MVTKSEFGDYELYTISRGDMRASVATLGGTIVSIKFHDKEMVLGYADPADYVPGRFSLNLTIGRYANRIGNASFILNDKKYLLPANEGKNILHGGKNNYGNRKWTAEIVDDNTVAMSIFSPDGDNGFPGNLTMKAIYSIEEPDTFQVKFEGETDADTVFAPTVHPYFSFGDTGSVLDLKMKMNASGHLEVDDGLIPTGNILPCEDEFDFSSEKAVNVNFDDAFVLNSEHALSISNDNVAMDMYTDMPAVQIYTGKGLKAPFKPNEGIAIEPEYFPDSPNHSNFPSTVLKAGEKLSKYVQYKFSEK